MDFVSDSQSFIGFIRQNYEKIMRYQSEVTLKCWCKIPLLKRKVKEGPKELQSFKNKQFDICLTFLLTFLECIYHRTSQNYPTKIPYPKLWHCWIKYPAICFLQLRNQESPWNCRINSHWNLDFQKCTTFTFWTVVRKLLNRFSHPRYQIKSHWIPLLLHYDTWLYLY